MMEGRMFNQFRGDKVHLLLVLLEQRLTSQEREGIIQEELEFLADPGVTEVPVTQTVITHNAAYQVMIWMHVLFEVPHFKNTDNDMLNQNVKEMLYSEQTHLVNYSESEITNDSNIIPYSQYLLETQNAAVEHTNSSAQQDAMILSVFEQLSNQTKTFNVFKNESKEKEAKNIDKEIALENKVKELDNIVCKIEMCNKCLELEVVLIKQHNMVEKDEYNRLLKSFSKLEQHCISLELAMQLNKEFFQKNDTFVNQTEPTFDHLFKLNNLKAELQAKDTIIEKLKANIKRLNKTSTTNSVKKDIDEIETINIELEHRVGKLIIENEHLKQTYKQLYDSIKPSRVHSKELAESLVNQINQKKFKGKVIVDNDTQVSNATTIAPGMYKLDPVTLAPKDKNNRKTHIYYLKHTMEQAAILKETVEQAKSLNPLDSASYSACKYVKLIQELL
nr:pyruvate, phosphate dikinase regulatory protein, chloroplastic [Tanacetum cinerariifolium]